MNAYRIGNDIVAAPDSAAARQAWAAHYRIPVVEAGAAELLSLELLILAEAEDGRCEEVALREVMPPAGAPAQIVAFGSCEGCDA